MFSHCIESHSSEYTTNKLQQKSDSNNKEIREVSATKTFKQNVSSVDHANITKNQEPCPLSDSDITSVHFTSTGGVMVIEEYGVKVNVPSGAIEDQHKVEIQAAASLFGAFDIPTDCRPVSAYVWIGANYTFKKPIEIEFEHHADISNLEDISQLCILKTCCTNGCTKCNSHHHVMHEITQGYVIRDSVCTLYTDHFCSQCLVAKGKPIPDKIVAYQYLPKNYKSVNDFKAEVCFCYDLECCKKVISHALLMFTS